MSDQQKLDSKGWSYTLRPIEIRVECVTWIQAQDVTSKAISPRPCKLIVGGEQLNPNGNGGLDDIQERIDIAMERLINYARIGGLK